MKVPDMSTFTGTRSKFHCEAVRPARASAHRSSRATKMLREDGEAEGRRGSLLVIGRLLRSLGNAPSQPRRNMAGQ
jgi:hypothetical protein